MVYDKISKAPVYDAFALCFILFRKNLFQKLL